jgi:hypothetical protein
VQEAEIFFDNFYFMLRVYGRKYGPFNDFSNHKRARLKKLFFRPIARSYQTNTVK